MSQGFTKGTPIDTDPTLSLNSDIVVPSQKAVKSYLTANYQPTLVSGTNIKTINGNTLLGSGDLTIGGGGLTVGTTAIASGTIGRILFQNGGDILGQDSALAWDNTLKRLTLRAVGTALTDIPFRVRNSADTADLFVLYGSKAFNLGGGLIGDGFTTYLSSQTGVTQITASGNGLVMTSNYVTSINAVNQVAIQTNSVTRINLDNVGNVGIGSATTLGARLDVRAQGALSTNIAFRVRNSADTDNLAYVAGNGLAIIGINASTSPTLIIDPSGSARATLRGNSSVSILLNNSGFNNLNGGSGGWDIEATGGQIRQRNGSNYTLLSGNFFGIGRTPSARLDVQAQGALSTDIAFRVRNSADTGDLISFRGDGSEWIQAVPFRHAGSLTGGTNANQSLYIGYNSRSIASIGTRNVIIGTGTGTTTSANDSVCIGHNASALNTSIAIGSGATASANNFCAMGAEAYPFTSMAIGTGGLVTSAANVQNMTFLVGGVAGGYTSNTDLSSKFFRIQSQGGSGTGNSAPIQFSVAPSGTAGFTANAFVVPFEVRGDAAGLNNYQLSTPRVPSASITDGYIQYSNDIVAGNAAPHFRTEVGDVIKLYKETTAITASTLVSNLGMPLTDTDTFDGYTLKQVVKALRNLGLLA